MPGRSWFVAAGDKQDGPYSEEEFRDLIGRGHVRADTYVWADGMQDWQYAGDIPGLLSGGVAPPAVLRSANSDPSGGSFSIDFGIWDFTWRTLVFYIGSSFIIPLPWLLVWYLKWLVPFVRVPGRPNLSFESTAMTIVPWFFGAIVLLVAIPMTGIRWFSILMIVVQVALYWLFLKWLVANLASDGQKLGLSFSGTLWAYLGWTVLLLLSVFTIIGWAWVYTAGTRWFCRHLQGTRRMVIFNGSGLEFLFYGIATAIGCFLIIPIPWVLRMFGQWFASQFAVVPRDATPERAIEAARV